MAAAIKSYDGLILALRARSEELGMSRETLDAIAGLPHGYSSKLLMISNTKSKKRLGSLSLWAILGALGIELRLVEDEAAMRAHKRERLERRDETRVRPVRNAEMPAAGGA
jgi:hypothetical protein